MRVSVIYRLAACVAIFLAIARAAAGQPIELTVADSRPAPTFQGEYWIDASGDASADAVLKIPAELFRPTPRSGYLGVKPRQAVWMRFSAKVLDDETRWYLSVPDTRVERATLYLVEGSGAHESWSAGSAVAVSHWPIPQIHPLFPLLLDKQPRGTPAAPGDQRRPVRIA